MGQRPAGCERQRSRRWEPQPVLAKRLAFFRFDNYFGDVKIVDVNIRRLRMKVEDEPSHPAHILTVWGYGYRWEE